MCRRQLAWFNSCGRYHIHKKCSDRSCPTYKTVRDINNKISSRTPKCDACRGVWLPVQIWNWLGNGVSSGLKKCGLGKVGKYTAWMFWVLFVGIKKITSFGLGVPETPRGKWWPKGVGKRIVILTRGIVFVLLTIWIMNKTFKFFGILQTNVPWYSKLFLGVTAPIRVPVKWTWYQLTGPRRGTVERVGFWVWNHTPAEVQALCHFLRGVLTYYVGWSWCEMRCSLFAKNGFMRRVRVEGCRWECFNKL